MRPLRSACSARPALQTWNIDNFPVYCVHAPRQEILSIKQIGWLVMVNCPLPEERDVPGYMFAKQSCGFAVYKDPNDIPEFVYKTLGFEKPPMWRNPPSGNNCIEEPPRPREMKPCQFDRASLIGV